MVTIERVQLELGRVGDPYFADVRPLAKLGTGGFSQVFLAEKGEERIALKRWDPLLIEDERGYEIFLREIEVMGSLKHRNIVQLLHATKSRSCAYLAMECVEGWNLLELIHSSQPFNVRFCVDVCVQVIDALSYMHSVNVMHRDLKADNVLVTFEPDSGDVLVKVCDFGLSRRLEEQQRPTQMQGTPYWTAPEVVSGKDYTFTADIFSFGIMLWEMCARSLPYSEAEGAYGHAGHNVRLLMDIVQQQRRPAMPGTVAATALGQLIRSCWAADPRERPTLQQIRERLLALPDELADVSLDHPPACACHGRIATQQRSTVPVSEFRAPAALAGSGVRGGGAAPHAGSCRSA